MKHHNYNYDNLLDEDKDLAQREANMRDTHDVLANLGIAHWLYEGALLGIYRAGGFIPWDWDVDWLLYEHDVHEHRKEICLALMDRGFKVDVCRVSGRSKVRLYRGLSTERVALNAYTLNTKYKLLTRVPYRFPARLFGTGTIEYSGVYYPCPTPVEEYLELAYGDWRTPVKSGDPNKYRRGRGARSAEVEERYAKAKAAGLYRYDTDPRQGYHRLDGDA